MKKKSGSFPATLTAVRAALALGTALCWMANSLTAAPIAGPAGSPVGGPVAGYSPYAAFAKQAEELGKLKNVKLSVLGRSAAKRDVILLTLGTEAKHKPAILILGNVYAPQLAGSNLAMRLATRLANDKDAADILNRVTVYIIPRPNPDGTELFFARPYTERATNTRATDDDRDGAIDEDGFEDLNKDGWITMLRVADPAGPYMEHPDDKRILIKADPAKNETGKYQLYSEGIDNDKDGKFNEDGPGGVDFNRNFTFDYPYFKPGAGPNQVSEPETRAVVDFAFDHQNIAIVFAFSIHDNLAKPWKPNAGAEKQRIKKKILTKDAPYFDFIAKRYQEIHGGKNAPDSPPAQGGFVHWAYFHFGRWSFGARPWWPTKPQDKKSENKKPQDKTDTEKPKEPAKDAQKDKAAKKDKSEEEDKGKDADKKNEGEAKPAEPDKPDKPDKPGESKKRSDEKRGRAEIDQLKWLKENGIDGFVNWTPVKHPDFPNRKVEVGGFKPLLLLNPPVDKLEPLAEKYFKFLGELVNLLPQLKIDQVKIEPLGQQVYRITIKVINNGYLPTMPQMGQRARVAHPLQIEWNLPKDAKLIKGHARMQLKPLSGRGGHVEQTWLLRTKAKKLSFSVYSPSVGIVSKTIELK